MRLPEDLSRFYLELTNYLCRGGYVFAVVGLSVSRITQKFMKFWIDWMSDMQQIIKLWW